MRKIKLCCVKVLNPSDTLGLPNMTVATPPVALTTIRSNELNFIKIWLDEKTGNAGTGYTITV